MSDSISTPLSEDLETHLNPPQKKAVETLSGPLLILAGAGSGKTRVITYRLAHLIHSKKASTDEILCMTFTNKAAREMETRASEILMSMGASIYGRLWISTFHATCVRILRQYIEKLGYSRSFAILDSADQINMIKKVLTALNINEKMYPAKNFQSRINSAKMEALSPDDLKKSRMHFMDKRSLEVYDYYEKQMKKSHMLDFSDLLFKTFNLFQEHPEVLETYQNKFRYIMVDEYQDTNHIQYRLVSMLSEKHQNLCVVGDEDQSIYSWRGADISNILNFEKDYPNAVVIKLEENYRSTQTIIDAATHLIKKNNERKNKTLFTSNAKGDRIVVREEETEYLEAQFVVRQIEDQISQAAYQYKDIAIFYRTNAQSRVLEEKLLNYGIPYKIIGGMRFYERMEIKDILAYLRVLANINDDISLKRIINVPARGIGKSTINKLEDLCVQRSCGLYEALCRAEEENMFNAGVLKKLKAFIHLLKIIKSEAEEQSLPFIYQMILDKTGYVTKLQKSDSTEARSRLENLEELNNALMYFEKQNQQKGALSDFLEQVALVSDIDSMNHTDNSITLMTLHISKGLEFPVVFIVGMEEGLFPSGHHLNSSDPSGMEEERRLAYVGVTRAKEKLFLSYSQSRRVWGAENHCTPSRFLGEIPEEFTAFYASNNRPRLSSNSPYTKKWGTQNESPWARRKK